MSKPFDLEAAKAGKPVETSDGCPVRLFCFDLKWEYPIAGAYTDKNGTEVTAEWTKKGSFFHSDTPDKRDLVMKSVKKKRELWINIYPHHSVAHPSIAEATKNACDNRLVCIPTTVEWDE